MKDKTLVILDASAFKDSSCILRLFNTVILGYRERLNSNDIEFGTAFHKFRSLFRNAGSVQEAMPIALMEAIKHLNNTPMLVKSNKKYLTSAFLTSVCAEYSYKYSNDNLKPITIDRDCVEPDGTIIKKGTKLLEPMTRFSFPYYIDDEVEILIAGTIDELATIDGSNVIVDAKTTSIWDSSAYFTSYNLSPQLITYRWALEKYMEAYPDSFLATITDCGAMIDGIFYKGNDKPVEFLRSKIYRYKESDLEEFDQLVHQKVKELVYHIKSWREHSVKPLRQGLLNGSCQTVYGFCKYFSVCSAADDEARESILQGNFIQKSYDPLTHGE